MKRPAIIAALLLSACASGNRPQGPRFNVAQPSDVIAAELAFARAAQDRGQWTAFRETATSDAEMFVPQRTNAQQWLRGRADPPVAVRWSPQAVWSSCDGSYAVTSGPWTGPNASGTFVTVWQRQPRGGYKWALDMGVISEPNSAASDTIAARVADCKEVAVARGVAAVESNGTVPDLKMETSADGSLSWTTEVRADRTRHIAVEVWNGTDFVTVLERDGRDGD